MKNGIGSYSRFLQGDKRAFEEIVALYSDALTFFAYGFVKDFAAAEDIMMDTFVALLLKKRHFRKESAFKSYLFRTARNKSIDYLRVFKRQCPIDFAYGVIADDTCEAAVIRGEERERMFAALRQLPAQYRDAVYLAKMEEFSVEETAIILKKSKKQIYNALARAKASLKKILSEEEF